MVLNYEFQAHNHQTHPNLLFYFSHRGPDPIITRVCIKRVKRKRHRLPSMCVVAGSIMSCQLSCFVSVSDKEACLRVLISSTLHIKKCKICSFKMMRHNVHFTITIMNWLAPTAFMSHWFQCVKTVIYIQNALKSNSDIHKINVLMCIK